MASTCSGLAVHRDGGIPEILRKPEMSKRGKWDGGWFRLASSNVETFSSPVAIINEMVSLLIPQYKENRSIVG